MIWSLRREHLAEELKAFVRERLSKHKYPRWVVFVDDVADNVATGIALGMHGHLFRDAERLRAVLKGYHLLA